MNGCVQLKPMALCLCDAEISDGQGVLHCQGAAQYGENLPEGSGAHHFGNERLKRIDYVYVCTRVWMDKGLIVKIPRVSNS